jgi:Eph receptor B1
VAAKVLKGGLDAEIRKSFLREAALMAMLNHPNIVQLVGVTTVPRDLPPLLIMQFCDRGSLESFLKDHAELVASGEEEELSDIVKLTFAGDVCRGLQYLASCRIVHRDIAARNVLLDAAYVILHHLIHLLVAVDLF